MSEVDMAVVEEPVQPTSQRRSSLGGQLRLADPEEVTLREEGNPEFKLPKTSSLIVVLMTNALMQVTSRILLTQRILC